MKPLVRGNIEVRHSGIHGFGVFATATIPANTLLEECHLLSIPFESTLLRSYQFKMNDDFSVLPLGYGAIYNHADQPNAIYEVDEKRKVMLVKSKRSLAKGEEIFISYGDTWFSSRHLKPAQARLRYRVGQWLQAAALPRFGLLALVLFMVLGHVST